jgi:hypothetical protein
MLFLPQVMSPTSTRCACPRMACCWCQAPTTAQPDCSTCDQLANSISTRRPCHPCHRVPLLYRPLQRRQEHHPLQQTPPNLRSSLAHPPARQPVTYHRWRSPALDALYLLARMMVSVVPMILSMALCCRCAMQFMLGHICCVHVCNLCWIGFFFLAGALQS